MEGRAELAHRSAAIYPREKKHRSHSSSSAPGFNMRSLAALGILAGGSDAAKMPQNKAGPGMEGITRPRRPSSTCRIRAGSVAPLLALGLRLTVGRHLQLQARARL